MIYIIYNILRSKDHVYANIPQRQVYDGGGVLEQAFVGDIGGQCCRGEQYQGRVAYHLFEAGFNFCLQLVFSTLNCLVAKGQRLGLS